MNIFNFLSGKILNIILSILLFSIIIIYLIYNYNEKIINYYIPVIENKIEKKYPYIEDIHSTGITGSLLTKIKINRVNISTKDRGSFILESIVLAFPSFTEFLLMGYKSYINNIDIKIHSIYFNNNDDNINSILESINYSNMLLKIDSIYYNNKISYAARKLIIDIQLQDILKNQPPNVIQIADLKIEDDIYSIFIDRVRMAAFNRNISLWYDNLSVITQIQDLTTKNGFVNIKNYLQSTFHIKSIYMENQYINKMYIPSLTGDIKLYNEKNILSLNIINIESYINNIMYNINTKAHYNYINNSLNIMYLNMDSFKDKIVVDMDINFNNDELAAHIGSYSYMLPYIEILPEKSSVYISNIEDYSNYFIEFNLHNVDNIRSVTFDSIKGEFDLSIISFTPLVYEIDFTKNVQIKDPIYDAEVSIKEFNDISDVKMEVINKYVKIRDLKKLNN